MSSEASTNHRPVPTNHVAGVIPLLIKEGSGVVSCQPSEATRRTLAPCSAEEGRLGAGRGDKDLRPDCSRGKGICKQHKNNTNEASMLLKINRTF